MLALQRYIRGNMKNDLKQLRKQGQKVRKYDICKRKFSWVKSDRLSSWLKLYDRYHVSEMHDTMLKLPVDRIPNVWRVMHCGLKEKCRECRDYHRKRSPPGSALPRNTKQARIRLNSLPLMGLPCPPFARDGTQHTTFTSVDIVRQTTRSLDNLAPHRSAQHMHKRLLLLFGHILR